MTKHLLTEQDCDAFRAALLATTTNHTGDATMAILDAVILFDRHRSDSFLRRAAAKQGFTMPATAKPALGLRYTR